MASSKQHYVPRFYLKAFASEPKRINLYNFKRSKIIKNVSLRDQCYQHGFYGADGDTESILARLEDEWARVLASIRHSKELPSTHSGDYVTLVSFVALQTLRTLKAADEIGDISSKIRNQILDSDRRFGDRFSEEDLNRELGVPENPTEMMLYMARNVVEHILDLNALLLISPRDVYITSDNPAFKYNQYCEGAIWPGATGLVRKGLQIFLPVSPTMILVLYDGSTYKPKMRSNWWRRLAEFRSIESLNAIQLVSARDNVYFSDLECVRGVVKHLDAAKRYRDEDEVVVSEYLRDDSEHESLLHTYRRIPNLSLRLSFLDVKSELKGVDMQDRVRLVRPKHVEKYGEKMPMRGSRTGVIRFSRKIG